MYTPTLGAMTFFYAHLKDVIAPVSAPESHTSLEAFRLHDSHRRDRLMRIMEGKILLVVVGCELFGLGLYAGSFVPNLHENAEILV